MTTESAKHEACCPGLGPIGDVPEY